MDGLQDEKQSLKPNNTESDGYAGDSAEPDNVKFVNGSEKIDSSYVDIKLKDPSTEEPVNGVEFVGLKKDELMQYAKDPYWVRLRIILLVLFAVIWVLMLVAAIVIIVVAPKCPPRPSQDWWETAVVYHIHPKSFFDSDGNGKGDLKGIQSKINYLKDTLGVTAVCLGPIQHSPENNFGYDITDFTSICHQYGSEEDFDNLRIAMHKKGMKLILDFVPNHTSRKNKWFTASQNNSEEFKDFYIWHSGQQLPDKTRLPPNNWLNVYGGSAWEFDEKRNQFFYHTYSKDEPDLNLRNPKVVQLLDDALLFWLKKKVDGFRFVGVKYLVESTELLKNETENDESLTTFQSESYTLVNHWRQLLDNYGSNDGRPKSQFYPRLMIADAVGQTDQITMFTHNDSVGANLPSNKILVNINEECKTECIYKLVNEWMYADGQTKKNSNWQVGNVDVSRIASRIGNTNFLNAIHMLLMTLPGTVLTYYGDELGMHDKILTDVPANTSLTSEQLSRVRQLSPMQWSDHHAAGFTTGQPWMPITDDYPVINVEAQLAHGSGMSPIKVFAKLVTLRNEPSIQWGKFYATQTRNIYYYVRQAEGFPGLLVAINFGTQPSTVNFKEGSIRDQLTAEKTTVVASTYNFRGDGRTNTFADGTEVSLDTVVYLMPGEGIVLKWELESSFL